MPLADYEELNTTALKIDQGDWTGDALVAHGGGGIRFKTIVGPDYGNYTWRVTTDKTIPGEGYGLLISSFSWFDYYLDFFQRYTTGATDVFVIDFRGKKWTVGLSDTKFPFSKVRLMNELFGTQGIQLEYIRVIGETDYDTDGSLTVPTPPGIPTGLTLEVLSGTSLRATWDAPPDVTAPSVPTSLTAITFDDGRIDLTWDASTDDVGVDHYSLRRATNAGFTTGVTDIDVGNVTSYSDTGLTASTHYFYKIQAVDAATNASAYSTSADDTTDAFSPISVIASAKAASANTTTATTPAIDTTGASRLIAAVGFFTGTSTSVSDSKGNTYVPLTHYDSSAGAVQIFECKNPIVGTGHTATATSAFPGIIFAALNKTDTTANADGDAGAHNNASATLAPGSLTPSVPNSIVVTAVGGQETTAMIDSGFTVIDSVPFVSSTVFQVALAYLVQTTATAENPTWTLNGAGGIAAAITSFKHR